MIKVGIWQLIITTAAICGCTSACTLAQTGFAQAPDNQRLGQETQARGYWVDPSTRLMWTAKDNGSNLNWHKAMRYCHDLRLANYSDWRLATIDELQGIADESPYGSKPVPKGTQYALEGWQNGGLLLTGPYQWSSSRRMDDRGHPSGYAWYFSFNNKGIRDNEPLGYDGGKRALCVRQP